MPINLIKEISFWFNDPNDTFIIYIQSDGEELEVVELWPNAITEKGSFDLLVGTSSNRWFNIDELDETNLILRFNTNPMPV